MSDKVEDAHNFAVAKAGGKEGARELLLLLGVDISTPAGILRAQRNFAFLDDLRTGTAALKSGVVRRVLGAIFIAIIGWALLGFRTTFHN